MNRKRINFFFTVPCRIYRNEGFGRFRVLIKTWTFSEMYARHTTRLSTEKLEIIGIVIKRYATRVHSF